jgi:hypothetical protein
MVQQQENLMTALMEVRVDPPSDAPSQTLSTRAAHRERRAPLF